VKINGLIAKKREVPNIGDLIELTLQEKPLPDLAPEAMDLDILYEDEAFLAINKPRGLVVHPAPGHPSNTLVNGLLHRYKALQGLDPLRPGIIHRLDKDTSGVLLIAKTTPMLEKLSLAFKERKIHKEYLAICLGNPGIKRVQNHLGRDPHHRQKMAITATGKESLSLVETLLYKQGYSLVKIILHTGRTHQIRVHMQSLGCPVLGDPLYGQARANQSLGIHKQLLHAHLLRFTHPLYGKEVEIQAKPPLDMIEAKKRLF